MPPRFNFRVSPVRPATDTATNENSRCFHTTADGRIALRCDWPGLFAALAEFPDVVLQGRHRAARLITAAAHPGFDWTPFGATWIGVGEGVTLRLDARHRAWARLAQCRCCSSPGRLEIHDAAGDEIFQVCLGTKISAAEWATVIAAFAATAPRTEPPAQVRGRGANTGHLFVPAHATPLAVEPTALPSLCDQLAGDRVPVAVTLGSPEHLQTIGLCGGHARTEEGLLTWQAGPATLQLALPAAVRLAAAPDAAEPALFVAGPGDTLLARFTGTDPRWAVLLAAAVP